MNPRYTVLTAGDGEEGLEAAGRERPDLMFLDIRMPLLDGYEVCLRLKSDPKLASIRIVMLTHMAEGQDRQRAMAVGADDYITKPFSPERAVSCNTLMCRVTTRSGLVTHWL